MATCCYQVFIHRNRDVLLIPLNRRIADHFGCVTNNMKPFYRRLTIVMIVAFFTVVTMNVLMFTSKIYFLIDGLRGRPFWQIIVFSAATVFPMMYVEVILVQFGLSLYWMRMQTNMLGEIMERVCWEETKLAPHELGQY